MTTTFTPREFVNKWRNSSLKERAAAQEHFIDLCRLVGHPTPAEADPTGARFAFEAGASKQSGGQGWADVWKQGYFAWEYKGKHANLDKAYQQLLQYREALVNPPLLVVSDLDSIVIHSNFTNTVKQVVRLSLDDLLTSDGLRQLRNLFFDPTAFRAPQTPEQVTQAAASHFAKLAELLRQQGAAPEPIAHFLIRLLFCLFAEDSALLPAGLFSRLIEQGRRRPPAFTSQLRQLFGVMATGGFFGEHLISHFNGGLFDSEAVLELDSAGLEILHQVAGLDWSNIEPSILGTLFERSLDPNKRAQLGAHYTSKEDILLIVEPVLMAPLRRRWATVQQQAHELAQRRDESKEAGTRTRRQGELDRLLAAFADEIASVRVLDPACGSGNFLYVALKQLLDLGKMLNQFTGEVKAGQLFPTASPAQLYGIEVNDYAYELAQITVWIGYIQWLHENGYGAPSEPILKPLHNILHMDAILAYDANGQPVEPVWPAADVIMGNPPFLGGNKVRQELGDKYVESLFELYAGRVPAFSDLVCYWFEHARALIEQDKIKRAGLLATNSIRGGVNRKVLERIKESGDIFMAWSDRSWILDGAAVRVSMVGFDNGTELNKLINGIQASRINIDLSSASDLTTAVDLDENQGLGFRGNQKGGPFDIPEELALKMLMAHNPHGKPNNDVVRHWFNGFDVTRRPRKMWLIDFGTSMVFEEAVLYEEPFEYVKTHVYPVRKDNNRKAYREKWWIHAEARPSMRRAIAQLRRFIVTPHVSKHRLFTWLDSSTIPDHELIVIARDDNYFFGVLHSKGHELWALRMGTSLEDRPRYTPTTCFETFPFPWPPGQEAVDDPRVQAISQAAQELVAKRDAWLNPPGLGEADLKKRTLTNLYNARPTWLDLAHKKLDAAVFAAYGWPVELDDEAILARLLALNLQRAQG